MRIPSVNEAEKMLEEAKKMNPGEWIDHCREAAICARTIAYYCDDLDSDTAYVLGLLHDIGRREGTVDLKHVLNGYQYLNQLGYSDAAAICLSHSFPYKEIESYNGSNDCSKEETQFLKDWLERHEDTDYDRLIQLCDALAYPSGPVYIEKRLVSVVMKKGFNQFTLDKWKKMFQLKGYFERKANADIYQLLYVK